jgi:SAM-dependent methyltransferase
MLDGEEPWASEFPAPLRRPLAACARGDIPANIAAMQLLMESRDPGEAEAALVSVIERLRDQPQRPEAKYLRAALNVLLANPQAWDTVKTVLGGVSHDSAAMTPEEQIRHFANAFDRAAQASPEGSVALYALGNPDLLRAATGEVVECMRDWGLLGSHKSILDLGCGIGRFGEALASEVGSVVGIDISVEMIETARRRCAAFANVTFLQSSGRDLSQFRDDSFDLVLAVDSFPYLVQSGMSLVETHIAEAARVLKPDGDLLVLNFSYRGDPGQDRADLHRLGEAFGYKVLRDGVPAFTLWDGLVFHLRWAPHGDRSRP